MSVVKLPITLCKEMMAAIFRFWWHGGNSARSVHWIRKDILVQPKFLGGLGFRDLISFNSALLAKQAWRFFKEPNSLWVRILSGIYLSQSTFLKVKKHTTSSWTWSSLLHGRDILNKFGHWRVGNGLSIDIWSDKWGPTNVKWIDYRVEGFNRVSDFIDSSSGMWLTDRLHVVFPSWLVRAIQCIPVSRFGAADTLVWPFTKQGCFTVKSCYNALMANMEDGPCGMASSSSFPPSSFWKKLWQLDIAPKLKFFVWKIFRFGLPTLAALSERGISNYAACPICQQESESVEHIFLRCSWVSGVWFGSPLGIRVPHVADISWMRDIFLGLITDKEVGASRVGLLCYIWWFIWKARNKFLFENEQPNPLLTIKLAVESAREFASKENLEGLVLVSNARSPRSFPICPHWSCPPVGVVKVNCDGAFDGGRRGGGGFIFRDWNGSPLLAHFVNFMGDDVLSIEGKAVFHALLTARRMGFEKIHVEMDCSDLFNGIAGGPQATSWRHSTLFHDICFLRDSFVFCVFSLISRKANMAADWIARKGLRGVLPLIWEVVNHPELVNILSNDLLS